MNENILHFYFLQYSRYEDLIYNINTLPKEREGYLLLAMKTQKKMEYLFRQNYEW